MCGRPRSLQHHPGRGLPCAQWIDLPMMIPKGNDSRHSQTSRAAKARMKSANQYNVSPDRRPQRRPFQRRGAVVAPWWWQAWSGRDALAGMARRPYSSDAAQARIGQAGGRTATHRGWRQPAERAPVARAPTAKPQPWKCPTRQPDAWWRHGFASDDLGTGRAFRVA